MATQERIKKAPTHVKRMRKEELIEELGRWNGWDKMKRPELIAAIEHEMNVQDTEVGIEGLNVRDGKVELNMSLNTVLLHTLAGSMRDLLLAEGGTNYVEWQFSAKGDPETYLLRVERKNGKSPAEKYSGLRKKVEALLTDSKHVTKDQIRTVLEKA